MHGYYTYPVSNVWTLSVCLSFCESMCVYESVWCVYICMYVPGLDPKCGGLCVCSMCVCTVCMCVFITLSDLGVHDE